jgi:hypothetical protein
MHIMKLKMNRCCIDKSSSAELSEAINSMFRWYQKATVCYVYLADVSRDMAQPNGYDHSEIARSRWFARGWTLQELIAPSNLIFYAKEWHRIGTKNDMCDFISETTRIDVEILQGQDLELVSVAKRMCWASNRTTTRVEDIAYCLLGIFDINMPLLYGEGKKAFLRLQEEILKVSGDHSLFAWGMPPSTTQLKSIKQVEVDFANEVRNQRQLSSDEKSNSDGQGLERPLLRGLLADSPAEFSHSENIIPLPWIMVGYVAPTSINRGITVSLRFLSEGPIKYESKHGLPLAEKTRRNGTVACAALQCRIEDDYLNQLALEVRPLDLHSFGRIPQPVLVSSHHDLLRETEYTMSMQQTVHIKSEKFLVEPTFGGNIIVETLPSVDSRYKLTKVHCLPPARYNERTRILNPSGATNGALAAFVFHRDGKPIFGIVLGRIHWKDYSVADCVILREENKAAEMGYLEDGMTEGELLDFMTHHYEPRKFGDDATFTHSSIQIRVRVPIEKRKSALRLGVSAEFVRIIVDQLSML